MKLWKVTFEFRAIVAPNPPPCRKVVCYVHEETGKGAEDYARMRFDLDVHWTAMEIVEAE